MSVEPAVVERTQVPPFPGAMAGVVDALLLSSPKQQPALSVLAALIGMAAGCAGAYRVPSGMRLNLYGIGIAATGAGKDAPRHAAVEIALCANAVLLGRPASGAGLEDELVSDRGMLVEIDEIAHLLAAASSSKAPAHMVDLSAMLLKMFSASRGVYRTRAKAKVNNATVSRQVENPTLNLLGFATPETLGAAVSAANITDGLLGRSLFAFGDANAPARRVGISFALPELVKHQGDAIRHAVDVSALSDGIAIKISDAAEACLATLTHDLDLQARRHESVHAQALTIRAAEKIERIAGVLSVWEKPSEPTIDIRHIEWAASFVESSDSAALQFVETHMHHGKVQANASFVIDVISRILSGQLKPDRGNEEIEIRAGRAPKSLVLKRSKMGAPDLDEAIRHLEATEQIDVYSSGNGDVRGRNRTTYSYVLRGST